MRKILLLFLIISCQPKNHEEAFELKVGDLLFQDLDSSPLCNAIETVTPGFQGASLSHIGIVIEEKNEVNNSIRILEALPNGVIKTKIDSFLKRSYDSNNNPKVIVGRLKPNYHHTITNAITFLNSKLGIEYDNEFIIDNEKYYCSELIYEAFEQDSIFKLINMTFLDPKNGETLKIWTDYYSQLGVEIPQDELGINPGVMSLSEKIDIVHFYGNPDNIIRK